MQKVIELVLIILIWTETNNANGIKGNVSGQNDASYHSLFNHDTAHREIPNPHQNHGASSTSFANVRFGTTGSYKSYTEHPNHKQPEPIQRKFPNQQPLKTTVKPLSNENEFRRARAITRSRSLPPRSQTVPGGIDFSAAKRNPAGQLSVPGGIDFSAAKINPEGRLCVMKERFLETISKSPIMKCTIKTVEVCPYLYNVEFKPVQEQVCDENFESKCQITFKMEPSIETLRKCNKPIQKVCDGRGREECKTVYETHCSTRYVKNEKKKFVGDTKCERKAIEMCGKGCTSVELKEQCQDEVITTMVQAPQMDCDLNPRKKCRYITKMMPSLKPTPKCQMMPKEVCNLDHSSPKTEKRPIKTEYCLDEATVKKDQTYLDSNVKSFGSILRSSLGLKEK